MSDTPELGLFSDFEGYRTPTPDDLAQAIKSSLVVLDTNVLLNLYGVHGTNLDDYIAVFEALDDRLFVPHQVLDEFWRNRRTVINENQGKHRERARINEGFTEIRTTFEKWYSRVVERGGKPPTDTLRELEEAAVAILDYIDEQTAVHKPTTPDTPTHEDPVLQRLARLLEGKVGPAPLAAERERLLREGETRVKNRVPPGYLDAAKTGERSTGDFFVWRQAMEASKARGLDVLLVTQDQKEDWWADRGTPSMRARPELVAELKDFSGRRLLMVRAFDLLELGGEHLGVEVSKGALAEAQDDIVEAWTVDLAARYLVMLGERNPEHLCMLVEAMADEDLSIERSAVAEIIQRDVGARMTGLTRPYDTVLKLLIAKTGMDPEPELAPMFAWYEEGGIMSHLVMDTDFARVAADAADLEKERLEELLEPIYGKTAAR